MSSAGRFTMTVTIDRRESDKAVLRTSDGQEIRWPADRLPDGLTDGAVLTLTAVPESEAADNRRVLAQDILNEIFNAEEGDQSNSN